MFRSRSAFDFYTPTVPSRDRDTKTKRVNVVNADYIDEGGGDIQTMGCDEIYSAIRFDVSAKRK